jgi:hypothetical protein
VIVVAPRTALTSARVIVRVPMSIPTELVTTVQPFCRSLATTPEDR